MADIKADRRQDLGPDEARTRDGVRPGAPHGESSGGQSVPAHVLLLVFLLAAAITRQGAYYPDGQRLVAPLLVAATVTALVTRGGLKRVRLGWPVGWAALLAVWAIVSATLAGDAGAGLAPAGLLAAVVGVLTVCRYTSKAEREALAGAAVAVGVLCALSGWVGVAWRISPLTLEDQGLWRAASTLTYANATAALLVPLALMALAWAAARPHRVLPSMAACLLLVGTAATLSRAGALALLVGGALLAVMVGPARIVRAVLGPAIGAAIAFAGLAPSMPAKFPPRPGWAAGALVAGLAVTAAEKRLPRRAVLAVIAGALALAAPLASQVHSGFGEILRPRLSLSSPDRARETAAAVRRFRMRPVTGTGPGRATLAWVAADGRTMVARYVHDEYLQVLVELGLVGLGLLTALLVSAARVVRAGRASAPFPEVWAGAAAGLAALAVHSAFDFVWHLTALPMLAALLVGITSPLVLEEVP